MDLTNKAVPCPGCLEQPSCLEQPTIYDDAIFLISKVQCPKCLDSKTIMEYMIKKGYSIENKPTSS